MRTSLRPNLVSASRTVEQVVVKSKGSSTQLVPVNRCSQKGTRSRQLSTLRCLQPTSTPSKAVQVDAHDAGQRRLLSTTAALGKEVMVKVPQMAESISEGTLRRLARNVGDYVEQDEEIASIETDKIDVAVNAPEAGIIDQIFVQEQDTVNVGQHVALVRTDGALDMDRDMSSTRDSQAPKIPADSISSARMTEPSRLAERESEVGRNMSSTTLRSHGSSHDSPSHAAGSNRGEHRVCTWPTMNANR